MSSFMIDFAGDKSGEDPPDLRVPFKLKDIQRQNIILVYYAFTSVTTVGFGDYYPKSDAERIIIAIFLFCGVMIFSLLAGEFLDMLTSYNKLNEIYEDSEGLVKFLGVLRKFNFSLPLNDNF